VLAGIAGLAALSVALPARALPGQSLAAFKTWAAGNKLLAGLTLGKDELSGLPAFRLSTASHGIAWRFDVRTDGRNVLAEVLAVGQVGKEPGTEPIRHDGRGYGFRFFSSLFGPAVAADFRASRAVASVKDPTNANVTTYYRGVRYGYVSAGTVALETPSAFASDVALAKRCSKTPQDCTE
jgi:hypothetical protein